MKSEARAAGRLSAVSRLLSLGSAFLGVTSPEFLELNPV